MEQIGARLREARMGAKIDINQVESDTKIRAKYLRAMENEEWSLLPGEIYAKTFLRTYADYLKLDSRELLDDYRRQYERPTDHDLRPLTSGRERERRPGSGRRQQPQPRGGGGFPIPPWVLVLVVLVVVGVALWIVGSAGDNNNGSATPQNTPPAPPRQQQRLDDPEVDTRGHQASPAPTQARRRRQASPGRPEIRPLVAGPDRGRVRLPGQWPRPRADQRPAVRRRPEDPSGGRPHAAADARHQLGDGHGQRGQGPGRAVLEPDRDPFHSR